MKTIILFLFSSISLFATIIPGTVFLMNDSPFILTASVYTQYGEFLGQTTLQAGQQSHFVTNFYSVPLNRPGLPSLSLTPYRIIWTCQEGEVYSMCTNGAVGSLIRATYCQGTLICSPPKKQK